MWCWLQPFGQPLILMWMRARERVGDLHRVARARARAALRPIDEVMPSLHESVPGHETTSLDLVGAGVAEAELAQRAPDLVDALVAHPAQQQVLVHGRAHPAARVARARCPRARAAARG